MTGPVLVAKHDLPIPEDARPGPGWSALMFDLAAHIGAYDVLRICNAYGGQQVYFGLDVSKAPFADVIGIEKAERLCRAFQLERITLPTARHALAVARRAPVLAELRAGRITVAEAAAMLRVRREHIAKMVRADKSEHCAPKTSAITICDPRQLDMFKDTRSVTD